MQKASVSGLTTETLVKVPIYLTDTSQRYSLKDTSDRWAVFYSRHAQKVSCQAVDFCCIPPPLRMRDRSNCGRRRGGGVLRLHCRVILNELNKLCMQFKTIARTFQKSAWNLSHDRGTYDLLPTPDNPWCGVNNCQRSLSGFRQFLKGCQSSEISIRCILVGLRFTLWYREKKNICWPNCLWIIGFFLVR